MIRTRRSDRGMTLIEILVVVMIIGILFTLVAPVLMNARAKAKRTECVLNLNAIYKGLFQYTQSYEDFLPAAGGGENWDYWYRTMKPFVGNWDAYNCPSKRSVKADIRKRLPSDDEEETSGTPVEGEGESTDEQDKDSPENMTMVHYGMNHKFPNGNDDGPSLWGDTVQMQYAKNPGGTIIICDAGIISEESPQEDPLKWYETSESVFDGCCNFPLSGSYSNSKGARPVARHMGKINVLFLNGAVETLDIKKLLSASYGSHDCLFDNR